MESPTPSTLKSLLNIFCSLTGHLILLKEANVIREHRCHEGCTRPPTMVRFVARVQATATWRPAPKVSQQNITLSRPVCLLPIVHPAAISFPGTGPAIRDIKNPVWYKITQTLTQSSSHHNLALVKITHTLTLAYFSWFQHINFKNWLFTCCIIYPTPSHVPLYQDNQCYSHHVSLVLMSCWLVSKYVLRLLAEG